MSQEHGLSLELEVDSVLLLDDLLQLLPLLPLELLGYPEGLELRLPGPLARRQGDRGQLGLIVPFIDGVEL